MKNRGETTEALLVALGGRGRFQIINHLLLAVTYIIIVFNHVLMAFHGTPIPHKCIPDMGWTTEIGELTNTTKRVNSSLISDKCSSTVYSSDGQNQTLECFSGQWKYMPKYNENNIVSEFDLVCDGKTLAGWATTIYFAGVMVGGIVFGDLADRFGRLPVMVSTMLASFAVGMGTAFSVSYLMFVILRFLNGILMQGIQTSAYTLILELFIARYRPFAGAVTEVYFGSGVLLIGFLAYFLRDWRHLQIAVSIPSLFAIVYILFTPESLRWLIAKRKMDKAEVVAQRISRVNQVAFPREAMDQLRELTEPGKEIRKAQSSKEYNLTYLFRTQKMRMRSVVLFYIWFVISTSYYGVTFKMPLFKVNRYLMFIVGGTIEVIVYALTLPVMNKFGRKKPLFVSFMMAAIMCISSGLVNNFGKDDYFLLVAILALAGRGFLACLFGVIFVYTTELYPTVIRNIGMGACCFFARLGGVFAPQITMLTNRYGDFDAIIVFGSLCLVAAFLVIPLTETHNAKLPDSIDDVEDRDHELMAEGQEDDKL